MTTYFISYDLRAPGRNYSPVHNYLQSFANWAKPLESVYIVRSTLTAAQIRDALQQKVDGNDRVLVMQTSLTAWAGFNLAKEVVAWLQAH
jgi:hypothetical protein